MLDKVQLIHYDRMIILLETEDCAPLLENGFGACSQRVGIIARESISDIFMLPEDIEDVTSIQDYIVLTKAEIIKLQNFRAKAEKFGWMDLESSLNIGDGSIIEGMTFDDITQKFVDSDEIDWRKSPRIFLRFFLLIEAEYLKVTGEELPFVGLDKPIDVDYFL